jgi:3-deoxy-D-manno-octulosonic-acid transferase
MALLLDFAYLLAGVILSPWIVYRLARNGGQRELATRLGLDLGTPLEGSIWLHGSSAGEVSLLKPLVALLERDLPATPLVISAVTPTGLAAARKLYPRHRVIAFPFDLSFIVRRAVRRFDPRLVIIVESEFWPNFISAARRRATPVVIVNGKMSEKSCRIHARTKLIPRVLADLSLIAVQSEEHADRFRSLGVAAERIRVTGNMKYDLARAPADLEHGRRLRAALAYDPNDVVIIGGSLHAEEDEALLDAYTRMPGAALMIVPRYPADADVFEQNAQRRGHATARKSAVDRGLASAPGREGVLIVDTVGELGQLYAASDIAFVGGSLFFRGSNKGGHNLILMEPAILGVPVLFGPYNFSFKETVEDLLESDAGRLVRDARELGDEIVRLAQNAERRRELGSNAQRVIREGQGATSRNYDLIVALLAKHDQRLQALFFDRKMPRPAYDRDSPV